MSTRSTIKYTKRCISDSEITLQTMNTFSIPHIHLIFQLNTPHMLNTISLKFQCHHAYVSAQTPPGYHWHTASNGPLRTVTGVPLQYTCYRGHPPQCGVVRSLGSAVARVLTTFLSAPSPPNLFRSTIFYKGMTIIKASK